ncbi:MAG: hypothetical protein Kow0020_10400 [Wenzhouxiangellaceae bacterium]
MKDWWANLQARERLWLLIGAGAVGVTLLWLVVWEPLAGQREALRAELAAQRALLDWLDRIEPRVRELRRQQRPERDFGGRSPLAVVDLSARAAGLAGALNRIEPGDSGQIRVRFTNADFEALMQWLETLIAERPLSVAGFEATRGRAPGRVDAMVVLEVQGSAR